MNWRIKDRDVSRADFSGANAMFRTATDTMNKGFDSATGGVESLNKMFDSRLLKTQNIENQRNLIEQEDVKSRFNMGMEQILAENPHNPLAQEQARNALIEEMRQQGGMEQHQLGQLGEKQTIDPMNKFKYVKNRETQLRAEANRLKISKGAQDKYVKDNLRSEVIELFGDDSALIAQGAGTDIGHNSVNSGAANVEGALGARTQGTPVTGSEGTAPVGTGTVGTAAGSTNSSDYSEFDNFIRNDLGDSFYAGISSPTLDTVPPDIKNYLFQLHNPDNNELRHLDPNTATFGEVRDQVLQEGGGSVAFGPFQIKLSYVDEGTYKRAGLLEGDKTPPTLENQRKLAYAVFKERIDRETPAGSEESELEETFVGLGTIKDEVLEHLGVDDLKGSTLVKAATRKYGQKTREENLKMLFADLEDMIIRTEGSPGTLEAVQRLRAEEGMTDKELAAERKSERNEVMRMVNSVSDGTYIGNAEFADRTMLAQNLNAVLTVSDEKKARQNANLPIADYERVANDKRSLVDLAGREDASNIDWVDGEEWTDKLKNVSSMVRGLKSVAAKENVMLSDAEAFEIVKNNYSADWFGVDIGKKWITGSGVDKDDAAKVVKELKLGEIAKTRQNIDLIDSAVHIIKSETPQLLAAMEDINAIKQEYMSKGMWERGLSEEESLRQMRASPEFQLAAKIFDVSKRRISNASSQLNNNPNFQMPRRELAPPAEEVADVKTGPSPDEVVQAAFENSPIINSLAQVPEITRQTALRTSQGTINNVNKLLWSVKKDTDKGQDIYSSLGPERLKSLEHITKGVPTGTKRSSRNIYPYVVSAIINDGYVLKSKDHLKQLMKDWEELESIYLDRVPSPKGKIDPETYNQIAASILSQ